MLALVSLEAMIPSDHPLRRLKPLADEILRGLSADFDRMYASQGRPSVPPERLLKAMVLIALYTVRSERLFCEQLGYNMLFRWFLDMDMMEPAFDATTFTHNRQRLIGHDVAAGFFEGVVDHARRAGLLSSEHFSVDGTMIESWASAKSFRAKGDGDGDNNGFGSFKGERRANDTHESKTDPEAKLWRKGRGREAKLAYMGHILMENRHGLAVGIEVTEANGFAEREAALRLLRRERQRRRGQTGRRLTVGADRGYAARSFVEGCRAMRITPHVAEYTNPAKHRLDARTKHHPGYSMSGRCRLLIEKVFGWLKPVGGMRRSRFRGRERTAFLAIITTTAYNLLRITNLTRPSPA
jgi:transposase